MLETGRMKPNMKRGGKLEYKYVKDAIRLTDRQVCIILYVLFNTCKLFICFQ